MSEIKSVIKAINLLQMIVNAGFRGISSSELIKSGELPAQSLYRYLDTLEQAGWLRSSKTGIQGGLVWLPGDALLDVAHTHRRSCLEAIGSVEKAYERVAGERLA